MPDSAETALEQTFADLANARLRDKSPALLDYLVGFQLVENNDDGSKAIGIFGFEIGDSWHYAPVFFFNGEIKGLDSLYSVDSDLFVPLSEDWINQVINRRENKIGDVNTQSKTDRGVRTPNYNRMRQVPGGGNGGNLFSKTSAFDKMSASREYAHINLPDALAEMGPRVVDGFIADLRTNTKLAHLVSEWYSLSDFGMAKLGAKKTDPVTIISSIAQDGAEDLSDAQKRDLLTTGIAVVDKRPEGMERSISYRTETKQILQNPTAGGWYEVLMADGEVRDLLVLKLLGCDDFLVYDIEDGKHGLIPGKDIYTVRQHGSDDFRKTLDDNSVDCNKVRPGDAVILCNQIGECTYGFEVEGVVSGENDLKTLQVSNPYYMVSGSSRGWGVIDCFNRSPAPWRYGSPKERINTIVVTEAGGGAIRYAADKLVVNQKHFRAIVLNHMSKQDSDNSMLGSFSKWDKSPYEIELSPSSFGDHNTIRAALEKVAEAVKIWNDGAEYTILDDNGQTRVNAAGAVGYLIRKHGCAADDAVRMVKEASHEPSRFFVKHAESLPFPEMEDTSEDGGSMSNHHRTQVPTRHREEAEPKDNRSFYEYNSPFGGNGDRGESEGSTMGTVERAAETGQKEVFDASVLSSLIKSHNPTDLVERFLPTIVSGMDRLGRLLFLVNWHYEDFQERYGDEDLIEYTDDLKSTFESLGDLILFMKKRTLSGDPDYYGLGLNASMAS